MSYNFRHGNTIIEKLSGVSLTEDQRNLVGALFDFKSMGQEELNEVKNHPKLKNISEAVWSIIVDLSICDENLVL